MLNLILPLYSWNNGAVIMIGVFSLVIIALLAAVFFMMNNNEKKTKFFLVFFVFSSGSF